MMARPASPWLRYRGLNVTPHVRAITWATRRAVPSSVGNPNDLGLLRNQVRTVRSWEAVSLRGRPGGGLAFRAVPPFRGDRACQS